MWKIYPPDPIVSVEIHNGQMEELLTSSTTGRPLSPQFRGSGSAAVQDD